MSNRIWVILEHMKKDVLDAIQFSEEISSIEAFAANPLYRKAIVMSIINIGELTKNLPDDFRSAHQEIQLYLNS